MANITVNVAFTLTDLFPVWKLSTLAYPSMEVVDSRSAADGDNVISGLTTGNPYLVALWPAVTGRWYPNRVLPRRVAAIVSGVEYGFESQTGTENALTGVSEPAWPTELGGSVVDGGVTWINIGTLPNAMVHGPFIAGS